MKISNNRDEQYKIQEAGLVSDPFYGEGRFIPALVVNSQNPKQKLEEWVNMHLEVSSGDVTIFWSIPITQYFNVKTWNLHIELTQPMKYKFEIEFNLEEYYSIINAIYKSRGLFIGYGNKGEKVSQKQNSMILIEVPETNTDSLWERTLHTTLKRKFKKLGVVKKDINNEIEKYKEEMKNLLYSNKKN